MRSNTSSTSPSQHRIPGSFPISASNSLNSSPKKARLATQRRAPSSPRRVVSSPTEHPHTAHATSPRVGSPAAATFPPLPNGIIITPSSPISPGDERNHGSRAFGSLRRGLAPDSEDEMGSHQMNDQPNDIKASDRSRSGRDHGGHQQHTRSVSSASISLGRVLDRAEKSKSKHHLQDREKQDQHRHMPPLLPQIIDAESSTPSKMNTFAPSLTVSQIYPSSGTTSCGLETELALAQEDLSDSIMTKRTGHEEDISQSHTGQQMYDSQSRIQSKVSQQSTLGPNSVVFESAFDSGDVRADQRPSRDSRSVSPIPSERSVSFAQTTGLDGGSSSLFGKAGGMEWKPRSASETLTSHAGGGTSHKKRSKAGSRSGVKVSDGSLSDSGATTAPTFLQSSRINFRNRPSASRHHSGNEAMEGLGAEGAGSRPAKEKEIRKARSFSDIIKRRERRRAISDDDSDDGEMVEPKRIVNAGGGESANDNDRQEGDSVNIAAQKLSSRERSPSMGGRKASHGQVEPPQGKSKSNTTGTSFFKSAAGLFGLLGKDKKKEAAAKKEQSSKQGSKAGKTSDQESRKDRRDEDEKDEVVNASDFAPPRPIRHATIPSPSPDRSSPVVVPQPSTPSRAAAFASSLTIRRRKRNGSSPARDMTSGRADSLSTGGRTPKAKTPLGASTTSGYFWSMSGNPSPGSSHATTPVDEFGAVQSTRTGFFDSPSNIESRSAASSPIPGGPSPEKATSLTTESTGPLEKSIGSLDRGEARARSPLLLESQSASRSSASSDRDISTLFDHHGSGTSRPALTSRSNSASSTIISRVKPTMRRDRSGSLLRDATMSATSGMNSPHTPNLVVSPTASTVSLVSSFGGRISRQPSYDAVISHSGTDGQHTPSRRNTIFSTSLGDNALPSVSEQPRFGSTTSSTHVAFKESPSKTRRSSGPLDRLSVQDGDIRPNDTRRKRSSTLFSTPPTRIHEVAPFGSPTRHRPANKRLSTGLFNNTWGRDTFYPSPKPRQNRRSWTAGAVNPLRLSAWELSNPTPIQMSPRCLPMTPRDRG